MDWRTSDVEKRTLSVETHAGSLAVVASIDCPARGASADARLRLGATSFGDPQVARRSAGRFGDAEGLSP
jgi:hypothetical protein